MRMSQMALAAVLGASMMGIGGLGFNVPSIRADLPKKRPAPEKKKAPAEPRALPAELSRQQRRYLERKGLRRGW